MTATSKIFPGFESWWSWFLYLGNLLQWNKVAKNRFVYFCEKNRVAKIINSITLLGSSLGEDGFVIIQFSSILIITIIPVIFNNTY